MSESCSWKFAKFELPLIDFSWHYHDEYEICLTLNSYGTKHIGDYIDYYEGADLVLLGPNLPHSWRSQPLDKQHPVDVYVARLPKQWLNNVIHFSPELQQIATLLNRSNRGIEFHQDTIVESLQLFQQIEVAEPAERYILILKILYIMFTDKDAKILSSNCFRFDDKRDISAQRLDKVIQYIYKHYTESLNADTLAELIHMSTNHFHRYFKQRTEQTLNQFITQLRIGKACKLLINTDIQISAVSDMCGFKNISNFNRRFRALKGLTPKDYRNSVHLPVSL